MRSAACCCITAVVIYGDAAVGLSTTHDFNWRMKEKSGKRKSTKAESNASSVRATITFPNALYATLEEIAKQKKSPWRGWSGMPLNCIWQRNGPFLQN